MPKFQNTLSVLTRQVGAEFYTYLPMKMEQTKCSETSAYKAQTPGNYPEENIKQISVYLVQVSYMFQPYVDTNRLAHKKVTSSQ
jgi:hypothetical protein